MVARDASASNTHTHTHTHTANTRTDNTRSSGVSHDTMHEDTGLAHRLTNVALALHAIG